MDAEVPPAPEARVTRERARGGGGGGSGGGGGGGGGGGDAAARIKRERAAARDVIDLTGEPRRPPPDPLLEARPAQNIALHTRAPFAGLSGRRQAEARAWRGPLCIPLVLAGQVLALQ